MTSWHQWSERKPTEADARGDYIEWHDSTTGARFIQPSWFSPYAHATGMYWRTPTPMPGEESGPAVADIAGKDAERYRFLAGADVPQHSQRWARWKVEYWDGFHGGWQPLVGTDLDAAIDAALAAVKAQEEGK